MKIEEAIQHCEDVSKNCEGECSLDHKQLQAWLQELVFWRTVYKNTNPQLLSW